MRRQVIMALAMAACLLCALAHWSCTSSPAAGSDIDGQVGDSGTPSPSGGTAHITGTICDRRTEGVAVADAYVYVVPSVGSRLLGPTERQTILAEGTTNSAGAFDLTGLAPGVYIVVIEPSEGSGLNGGSFGITVSEGATVNKSLRLGAGDQDTCFADTREP